MKIFQPTSEQARFFNSMTFPAFRHLLDLEPKHRFPNEPDSHLEQPLAVAAADDSGPVGLALVGLPMSNEVDALPELLSIFIRDDARRQGHATRLLEAVEEGVAERGFEQLKAVYMTGKPHSEAVEKIFARRQWQPPETRMYTVRFTLDEARSTAWYQRYRGRQLLKVVPWTEVPESLVQRLRRDQAEDPWIPEQLTPWTYTGSFEPISSLGAILDGELVGWVINHVVEAHTVRFTCSFMRPDLARRGRIVPLYSESIRRLEGSDLTTAMFTVPVVYPFMVSFLKRRCAPFATYFGETRGAVKMLRPS